jgi:hypothetical protein
MNTETEMTPEVRAFLEGKQFIRTDENILLLRQWFTEHSVPQTPETSAQALYDLSMAGHSLLEYTPKAAAKIAQQQLFNAQAAEAAEAARIAIDPVHQAALRQKAIAAEIAHDDALFASWEKRLPNETALQHGQRVHDLKNAYFAKDMERFYRRVNAKTK